MEERKGRHLEGWGISCLDNKMKGKRFWEEEFRGIELMIFVKIINIFKERFERKTSISLYFLSFPSQISKSYFPFVSLSFLSLSSLSLSFLFFLFSPKLRPKHSDKLDGLLLLLTISFRMKLHRTFVQSTLLWCLVFSCESCYEQA